LELTGVGDLLAEPEEMVNWLVDNLIPAGSVCLLAVNPKVGKSTAARHLALAHARGETWLGQAWSPGTVWYLAFDGRRRDVRAHFRQMGATALDAISVVSGQAPKNVVGAVLHRAKQEHPTLVIIDTMQRFVQKVNDAIAGEPLPKPVDAANALLDTHGVPRHVVVDDGTAELEVEAFGGGVGVTSLEAARARSGQP
jgi:hypothetical protein